MAKRLNAQNEESLGESPQTVIDKLSAMFEFSDPIRKVIYTTNAIESLNMTLRKAIKNKRIFPNDTSVFKSLYLAILDIERKWTMPIRDWQSAFSQLLIKFAKV